MSAPTAQGQRRAHVMSADRPRSTAGRSYRLRQSKPMLANVLLRTQGKNQLLVAATDLNVSLTAELKSNNASEGGLTLGAKNLYELIANAPGDEITLKKADNHWAEIKSGKVTYRIVGMPDRDFPKVPDHREARSVTELG